ncbi:MAG: M48 family metalloprotease [Marinilabiliales bacterium]|nr:M48 family metalloprotease [Marinilabiliales bacterium]
MHWQRDADAKINVIEDDSLNAFASGINTSTFTVSLSRGIINKLDDARAGGGDSS